MVKRITWRFYEKDVCEGVFGSFANKDRACYVENNTIQVAGWDGMPR